jgi:hypothetical protein
MTIKKYRVDARKMDLTEYTPGVPSNGTDIIIMKPDYCKQPFYSIHMKRLIEDE